MSNLEVITQKPEQNSQHKSPILCVHGAYHGAWCWNEYFLPYFAKHGYESYALSLRGHGKSHGHEQINKWRIADYVIDVESVASQLSTPPILIGHSLGGTVIQKYMESHSVPAGILLTSTLTRVPASASLNLMLRYPLPILKMFLTGNTLHYRPTLEATFFSADMPREQMKSYFARLGNESFRVFTDLMSLDQPKRGCIKTPMLVISEENDSFTPRPIKEAIAQAYNTKLETFPVAHDMMLDTNWEMVACRIVNWLAERNL